MYIAETPPGTHITDMMVYDRMRLNKKARDLSLPQPQEAVYFGTANEDIGKYCATLKKRHPEVDRPMETETCQEELLLLGKGLPHGRLCCINNVVKPTLTTSYTRLKAGLPKDSHQIPPRRQPR